jgi:DNA-binding response OmpR family regulator
MEKHVLVVDDEPAVRYTLAFAFRMSGYEVSEAGDGEEALALILRAVADDALFDLLLVDIMMPRMNGEDLIGELKKKGIFLPTIVVTASRDMDLINRLLTKGCTDYFFKPYDIRELVNRVGDVLETSGQLSRPAVLRQKVV